MYQFTYLLRTVTPAYFLMRDGNAQWSKNSRSIVGQQIHIGQRDNLNCLLLKQCCKKKNVRNREKKYFQLTLYFIVCLLCFIILFKNYCFVKKFQCSVSQDLLYALNELVHGSRNSMAQKASGIITPKPVVQWLLVLLCFLVLPRALIVVNQSTICAIDINAAHGKWTFNWFSHYDWRNRLA